MGASNKNKKKIGKSKPVKGTETSKRRKIFNPKNTIPDSICVHAEDLELYDSLNNDISTLQVAAKDWIKKYSKDEDSAVYQILGLITKVGGCNLVISKDVISQGTDFELILKELENTIKIDENPDYIFGSRSKESKNKKKKVLEFFNQVVKLGFNNFFSEENSIETLINWLAVLSNSEFRPLRHAATSISLNLISYLCDICLTLQGEKSAAIIQEKTGKKNKKKSISNTNKSQDIDLQIASIETTMDSLFESVFVNRYRDIDANIRMEGVQELVKWITKYPSHYLKDDFLKYAGMQLSDKSSVVRGEALQGITKIFDSKSAASKLRRFTLTFKARILEIGHKEVDVNVQCQALALLLQVYNHGFLEEDEKEGLVSLIFHKEAKVRSGVAPFISTFIETELYLKLTKKLYNVDPSSLSEDDTTKVLFKCLYTIVNKTEQADKQQEPTDSGLFSYTDGLTLALRKDDKDTDAVSLAIKSLWSELEFARNLEFLLELIGRDPPKQKKKVVISFDDQEKAFLVKVLEVGFKILAAQNEILEKSDNSKKLEEVNPFKQLQGHLVQEIKPLTLLVNKFMTEDFVVIPILRIVRFAINGELFLEANKLKPYIELIKSIQKLFLTRSSPTTLFQAVKTLKALSSFTSVPQDINDCTNSFVQGLIEKLISSIGDLENEEAYLQRIRAVLIQVPWNYEAIYRKSTSQFPDYLYKNTSKMIQIMDNVKMTIASLDILYRCFLWGCHSLPDLENQTEVSEESVNELIDLRNHLVDSCLFIIDVSDASDESFEIQRHAYLILNDLCWLSKNIPALKEHSTEPSIYRIGDRCTEFTKKVIIKWEDVLQNQSDAADQTNIVADSALRHNFNQIFTAQIRSVLARVFHSEASIDIISYYGSLDPILNESIKVLLNEGLKFKLKNSKDAPTITKSLKFVNDALFKSFNRSITSPLTHPFDNVTSLTKLYASTLRNIGTNTAFISESLAQTHLDFATKAIQIYSDNLKSNTITELSTLLIFRLLNLLVKSILSPIHAQELLKRVEALVQDLKPDQENIEWQLFTSYTKSLQDACSVLKSATIAAAAGGKSQKAATEAQVEEGTPKSATGSERERDMDISAFTFNHPEDDF